MAYWLVKSEPSSWSWDQQVAKGAKGEAWTGVRNFTARQNLVNMKKGDLAFFYHSSADPTGVAGIVKIVGEARPDATALDAKNHHHDPKSTAENPIWYGVDIKLERKLKRIVTLADLKAQKSLQGMTLLRPGNRLSVMPVEKKHWDAVLDLE